jgi:hypothetical protein
VGISQYAYFTTSENTSIDNIAENTTEITAEPSKSAITDNSAMKFSTEKDNDISPTENTAIEAENLTVLKTTLSTKNTTIQITKPTSQTTSSAPTKINVALQNSAKAGFIAFSTMSIFFCFLILGVYCYRRYHPRSSPYGMFDNVDLRLRSSGRSDIGPVFLYNRMWSIFWENGRKEPKRGQKEPKKEP